MREETGKAQKNKKDVVTTLFECNLRLNMEHSTIRIEYSNIGYSTVRISEKSRIFGPIIARKTAEETGKTQKNKKDVVTTLFECNLRLNMEHSTIRIEYSNIGYSTVRISEKSRIFGPRKSEYEYFFEYGYSKITVFEKNNRYTLVSMFSDL